MNQKTDQMKRRIQQLKLKHQNVKINEQFIKDICFFPVLLFWMFGCVDNKVLNVKDYGDINSKSPQD